TFCDTVSEISRTLRRLVRRLDLHRARGVDLSLPIRNQFGQKAGRTTRISLRPTGTPCSSLPGAAGFSRPGRRGNMRKLLLIGSVLALIVVAAGCKVVVTPSAPNGWSFLNEGTNGSG